MPEKFCGFKPEAYIFLTELGFNNNKQWMDENRWRYKEYIYKPLCRLGEMLLPTMLDIDYGVQSQAHDDSFPHKP